MGRGKRRTELVVRVIAELIESALIAAVVSAAVSYAMRPKQITRKVRGPYKRKVEQQEEMTPEQESQAIESSPKNAGNFAVSGPARIPWRSRRKELEAQHRMKRRAIEEFREG